MRLVLLDMARVGPSQMSCPMRAGPRHQHLALALALLGLGQADPRANRARPLPLDSVEVIYFGINFVLMPTGIGAASRRNSVSLRV